MCKPHKANGMKGMRYSQTLQERRAREADEHLEEDFHWRYWDEEYECDPYPEYYDQYKYPDCYEYF
jgi:hypothetical protein